MGIARLFQKSLLEQAINRKFPGLAKCAERESGYVGIGWYAGHVNHNIVTEEIITRNKQVVENFLPQQSGYGHWVLCRPFPSTVLELGFKVMVS